MTSDNFPALIFEPNPPSAPFHKNATRDAPNAPRLAAMSVTAERLKNIRRETPSASSSGATNGSTATGAATATSVERDAASTSRPVGALPEIVALRSRERVSRDNAPAPRTSELRAVVNTTIAPKTTAAITTIVMTIPVLMPLRSLFLCLYVE